MHSTHSPYIRIGNCIVDFGGANELPQLKDDYGSTHIIPQGIFPLAFFNTQKGQSLVALLSALAPDQYVFKFTTETPTHTVVDVEGKLMLAQLLQLQNAPITQVVLDVARVPRSSLTPNGQPGQFPPR